jgi:hypothetical protein
MRQLGRLRTTSVARCVSESLGRLGRNPTGACEVRSPPPSAPSGAKATWRPRTRYYLFNQLAANSRHRLAFGNEWWRVRA